MSTPVLSRANRKAALDALIAGGLNGAKMILFTNEPALTENTVFADLVEPTFTGYAISSAVTWSAVYEDADGSLVTAGSHKTFIATAAADETINGYAIVDSAGTTLEFAAYLDTPVPIVNIGDGLTVDPVLFYGS